MIARSENVLAKNNWRPYWSQSNPVRSHRTHFSSKKSNSTSTGYKKYMRAKKKWIESGTRWLRSPYIMHCESNYTTACGRCVSLFRSLFVFHLYGPKNQKWVEMVMSICVSPFFCKVKTWPNVRTEKKKVFIKSLLYFHFAHISLQFFGFWLLKTAWKNVISVSPDMLICRSGPRLHALPCG